MRCGGLIGPPVFYLPRAPTLSAFFNSKTPANQKSWNSEEFSYLEMLSMANTGHLIDKER
jgi:hypothetical protein